jgi:hypothetical protein
VPKSRYVEFRDGELGEVQRDQSVHGLPHDEQKFYRQLMWLAKARSRKSGWAAHKFKEKFGRFPPWSWNNLEPLPPAPDVVAWVRSRDIAYAKAMQAQR